MGSLLVVRKQINSNIIPAESVSFSVAFPNNASYYATIPTFGYKYLNIESTSSGTLGNYKVAGVSCNRTTTKTIDIADKDTFKVEGTASDAGVWMRPKFTLHN